MRNTNPLNNDSKVQSKLRWLESKPNKVSENLPDNFWPIYDPERSDLTSKWHFSAGENEGGGGGKEEVLAPAYVVMYVLSAPRPPHCLPGFNDSLLRLQ